MRLGSKVKVAPRVELSSHLATIESYLEDYRTLKGRPDSDTKTHKTRQSNRDKFQKYILTSCWPKMLSRAEHWISIEIITSICNITEENVTTAADFETVTIQVDRDLREFIKGGLGQNSYIPQIMEYDIYRKKKPDESFPVDSIVNVETHIDQNLGEVYTYTSDIAVAFQHLLVSSLLSYVFRLKIVNKAVKALPNVSDLPIPQLPPVISTAFIQLLLSAQLLFVVSHSKLFKHHLKVLNTRKSLSKPTDSHAEIYAKDFETFAIWHACHVNKDATLMRDIEVLKPATSKASAVSAVASGAPAEAPITEADADEVLPESEVEVEMVYRKWIIGLVDHFAAIRVLERVSGKLSPEGKINFSILGLNRPSLPNASWDVMVGEIRSLCEDRSLFSRAARERLLPSDFANRVIKIIETKVKQYPDDPGKSVNKTSARFESMVYSSFKKLLSTSLSGDLPVFTGCGHCEAILMAIIHRICNQDDLDFSLKACSPFNPFSSD